ncbi:GIY-YIG nuclease family protein [Candidatus Shapirobacteria bacterium]|nr:GIY-YIG nuclease family protein [Candidatus Shapirobacteria bacterium]
MFYVYLLKSLKNNKSYVGFTSKNPSVRLEEHNRGTNKFTKDNGPWKLVYYETFFCKECAQQREKFLKTGVGKKLKAIILDYF